MTPWMGNAADRAGRNLSCIFSLTFSFSPYPLQMLESMTPWMGGGEMIQDVFLDHSTYAAPPARFEAGTPAIGEAIGLGAAVDYLTALGMDRVHDYENELSR